MLLEILKSRSPLTVPGVYDGLSARIANQAGFEVIYMSGFAVAGSLLGKPDIGLVSGSEMAERAGEIVSAAPEALLIADGDNGHGNEHNVARLVRAYEQAGVACIQLEDQVSPKKCGHMENKQVVSREEAIAKIRAAVNARSSNDFLIMARTDARATDNLDEALKRADGFLEAGADILFVEAPQSVDEMKIIGERFSGVPLVANLVEAGKTPELTVEELGAMGFSILLRPISGLLAVAATLQASYASLKETGQLSDPDSYLSFAAYNQMIGLDDYR